MIICGIDPGLDGGLAILDGDGVIVGLYPMPVIKGGRRGCKGGKASIDVAEVRRLIAPCETVVIEDVFACKGQSATGALSFGRGWGTLYGLAHGLDCSVRIVKPQAWKRAILAGTAKDKAAAIRYALDRWPGVDLKPGKKTTYHDGLADALGIAAFGLTI